MVNLSPYAALVLIMLCSSVYFLPRHYLFLPFIVCALYLTLGQRVILFGLDFYPSRILILFGALRVALRGELAVLHLKKLDKTLLLWVLSSVVTYTVLWRTPHAFINRLGFALDALGLYFLFRISISEDNIVTVIKSLAILVVPIMILMAMERMTGKNTFAVLGGVPIVSEIRDGRVRCQGPFRHPILAGTFGATSMPLFAGLWYCKRKNKILSIIGMISATAITILSASSGPLMAYVGSIVGLSMWRYKKHMKAVRRMIIVFFIILAMIMKAPVYYILARVGERIGGGGWYRSYLIDQAIKHFSEWWLVGTKNTAQWMPVHLSDNKADITNQFISQGVNGGLVTMILFIAIIAHSFKNIGIAIRKGPENFFRSITLWCIGSSLFAHILSFISVAYFDQILVFWYLLIAMICCLETSEYPNKNCHPGGRR